MRVVIKGGRIIDPANDVDREQDLYIADGKILARGRKPQDFKADHIIDAKGQVVCPGLVDLRARLREPGDENKGTIASETAAAAKGGVTTLCCPPDTDPVIDTPAVVELIHQRAEQAGKAKVVPLGALTQGLKGEQLSEMNALKRAGCVGISNVHKAMNSLVMRRAMEYAASEGLTVYIHPEDYALSLDGCAHEGVVSVRLGLPGIPEAAETLAVAQALQLIELTDAQVHFCQLSTSTAAHMIARAQYDGAPITADVTAHHLFLTEMDIGFFNPQCHVRPPLRTQRDRDGLRDALVNGTISAICSDHQPHEVAAKLAPFPSSEPGISAIETLLPLTLRLVDEGLMSLADAIARVSFFPANILEIAAGTLDAGASADVCIFHPDYEWQLRPEDMVSFGKNTPFANWRLKGRVTHTLLNGEVVYRADEALLQDMQQQQLQAAEVSTSPSAAEEASASELHEEVTDEEVTDYAADNWDVQEDSVTDDSTTATALEAAALTTAAFNVDDEVELTSAVPTTAWDEGANDDEDIEASTPLPDLKPLATPLAALNASVLGQHQQEDSDDIGEPIDKQITSSSTNKVEERDSEMAQEAAFTGAKVNMAVDTNDIANATAVENTGDDVAQVDNMESTEPEEYEIVKQEAVAKADKEIPAKETSLKNLTAKESTPVAQKSTDTEHRKNETSKSNSSAADIDDLDHW